MAIEVRLYGKLRRFAAQRQVNAESLVHVERLAGDTIERVLTRLGISREEVSNVFLDGELSGLSRQVADGSRLGVFPDDMALLYTWYFEKKG